MKRLSAARWSNGVGMVDLFRSPRRAEHAAECQVVEDAHRHDGEDDGAAPDRAPLLQVGFRDHSQVRNDRGERETGNGQPVAAEGRLS